MWDEPNVQVKVPNSEKEEVSLLLFSGLMLDTIKGVAWSRQKDGGHGSRNPLRSV